MLRIIPQSKRLPKGLGRHIDHDPANRDYDFRTVAPKGLKTHDVSWAVDGLVLDQKLLSGCTGFAAAGLCNTTMFKPLRNKLMEGKTLQYKHAVNFYRRATRFDPFPGVFEPNDQGSTGNAAAKALREAGYIDVYRWCFSFDAFVAALMTQPVMVGTYWTNTMFNPDNGLVRVGRLTNDNISGGHEYLCTGVRFSDNLLLFRNSWGSSFGKAGNFTMYIPEFQQLLKADGDVTVPHGAGLP